MASNNEDNKSQASLDLTQVKNWYQLWCQGSEKGAQGSSATSTTTTTTTKGTALESSTSAEHLRSMTDDSSTLTNPKDPLLLTRIWIKQQISSFLQHPKQLDTILKWLLRLSRDNLKVNHSNQGLSSTNKITVGEATISKSPVHSTQQSILKIEWMVVLLLEIRLRCTKGPSLELFWQHFVKVDDKLNKSKSKDDKRKRRKRKRQMAADDTPQDRFFNTLTELLTRLALLLPSNEPFGAYVCQKCLTRYHWNRNSTLVGQLLDYFEIDNPYLAKDNDHDEDSIYEKRAKKKAKRAKGQPPAENKQTAMTTRRPLFVFAKQRDNRRINHFHGMMADMEKMLDSPSPVRSVGAKKSSMIKPSFDKATNKSSSPAPKTRRPVGNDTHQSVDNSSIAKKKSKVAKSPVLSLPNQENVKEPKSLAATTTTSKSSADALLQSPVPCKQPPVIVETPVPTKQNPRWAAETPMTAPLDITVDATPSSEDRRVEMAVAETPCYEATSSSHRTCENETASSSSRHRPNKPAIVRPLKLFAALKPESEKNTTGSKSKTRPHLFLPCDDDNDENTGMNSRKKKSSSSKRSTSLAVAAARSFLQRKSMS